MTTLELHSLLALAVLIATALLKAFKDLTLEIRDWLIPTIVLGIVAGGAIVAIDLAESERLRAFATPAAVGIALFWLRSRRIDVDYVEGLLSGTAIGAIAALPLLYLGGAGAWATPRLLICGGAAGLLLYTFAPRLRRVRFAALLVTVAALYLLIGAITLAEAHLQPTDLLVAAIAAIVVTALVFVAYRWWMLRKELQEEAGHGVIEPEDVALIANPFQRLRTGVWLETEARKHYVRMVTELAIRKRRQRRMPGEAARLYQIEIMKLRMAAQELRQIELQVRRRMQEGDDEAGG
jgi:hypothetical protein